MDERARARARLYLRSERAMGLNSVQAIVDQFDEPGLAVSDEPAEAPGLPRQPDQPVSQENATLKASAPVLFGGAELVPSHPPQVIGSASAILDGPSLTTDEKRLSLLSMNDNEVRRCTKCRLCETRTQTVFGEGDADAKIFFIGEGPGETEDQTGRPFVGRAGELLNKMIGAMGLSREQVYIANIVKCRPPNNRVPAPDEVATCTPYLTRQLEIIRPRAVVTLGLPASQYMLQTKLSMGRLRGQWHSWRGIKLMPTYHPAYVLRNPTVETRAAVWSDLKQVLAELGLPVPKKNI